jgi:hypothetical protein
MTDNKRKGEKVPLEKTVEKLLQDLSGPKRAQIGRVGAQRENGSRTLVGRNHLWILSPTQAQALREHIDEISCIESESERAAAIDALYEAQQRETS